MTNRIHFVGLTHHVTDPTLAEVWVTLCPERLTASTELRGRLTGPRCAYSTTVEVPYPVRERERLEETEERPHLLGRIVIPDPCLWEPQTPFLYEGVIELWQDGQCCERAAVSRGLRDLKLIPQGLRLNGRPFTIRAAAGDKFSPDDLPRLRRAGFNTIFVPSWPHDDELREAADRLGIFILGWLKVSESEPDTWTESKHPSDLGYVVLVEMAEPEVLGYLLVADAGEPEILSSLISHLPPDDCRCILCDHASLSYFADRNFPKLVRINRSELDDATSDAILATPGVLGWVLDPAV